jgi:hypothetical protein
MEDPYLRPSKAASSQSTKLVHRLCFVFVGKGPKLAHVILGQIGKFRYVRSASLAEPAAFRKRIATHLLKLSPCVSIH